MKLIKRDPHWTQEQKAKWSGWLMQRPAEIIALAAEFPPGLVIKELKPGEPDYYLIGYGEGEEPTLMVSQADPWKDYEVAYATRKHLHVYHLGGLRCE